MRFIKGLKEILRGRKKEDWYTLKAEVVSGYVDFASTKLVSKT